MHELSLAGAIVNTVVKHAGERPVSVVTMRIGALRQVVPDTLDFYFDFVSEGTVCQGAKLEFELIPAVLRCAECAREWETDMPIFICPQCGPAGRVEVARGDEFEVESIDVEEAECIAQR